jgi:hypothetical protein
MFALLSLVVCLTAQPMVCETVVPDYVHHDTGQSPTFFECLGPAGQTLHVSGSPSTPDIFCAASNVR